ncbi:hypothetical protein GCM10010276_48580 [Streptomyces longisporus]|uniref:Uncharacterized protein n=1 Tax=Streptomyces longisporus TaxID=1948 RepID=A0ABP5ZMA4_STRLO
MHIRHQAPPVAARRTQTDCSVLEQEDGAVRRSAAGLRNQRFSYDKGGSSGGGRSRAGPTSWDRDVLHGHEADDPPVSPVTAAR